MAGVTYTRADAELIARRLYKAGLGRDGDAAGLSGIFYGLDVVHEFQVVTSGGQAELGRALAKSLANKPAVLMRGHGAVIVAMLLLYRTYRRLRPPVSTRRARA